MSDDDVLAAMGAVDSNPQETLAQSVTASVADNEQVSADTYSMPLTKDNFVKFSSALAIIQNICNDCDIHEGKIRCRTNDHKNMILMDLTSIVGARNITFSGLKNKLSLLGTFTFAADAAGDTSVLVEANESNFEFSDSMSRLIMRRPIASYLENIYLTDDEFESINNSINREDAVLFNASINSVEKKRIAKLCDLFCSNTVTFEFNGNTASYTTQTSSKDNLSKTNQVVNLLKTLDGKKTLINNLAFVLDTPSNLDITCYQIGTEFCMFKANLNYYGIPVQIYTKSRITDLSEEND